MASAFSFALKGVSEVQKRAKAHVDAKVKAGAGALYELAEEVIAASQPLVPVEFGILKNSRFVKKPVIRGENASVQLGYGGQAEAYAVVQHEDLTLNHPNGGQAKFLEIPFLEMRKDFAARLAAKIKERTEK